MPLPTLLYCAPVLNNITCVFLVLSLFWWENATKNGEIINNKTEKNSSTAVPHICNAYKHYGLF